ncbi:ferredoxin [Cryobacterium sp. Y50]|uniref:ferredoxin n=1 Tax=Cryobacterium sp. Y50 TaxID=2048286 RepID=UPI000CE361DF|nr:ferredoxin [Cryobacterium sp. Y50]
MIDVTIDLSRCQGYGNCVSAAPEVFDINDEGHAFLLMSDIGEERLTEVQAAVKVCPVAAISVAMRA